METGLKIKNKTKHGHSYVQVWVFVEVAIFLGFQSDMHSISTKKTFWNNKEL